MTHKRLAIGALVAIAALAACGSDDDKSDSTPATPLPATTKPGNPVVNVTASDYSFAGIPATVQPGTVFSMTNASTKEVHEMVVVRLPDNVKEPIAELLALPEEELNKKVPDTEPSTVIVALPGQPGRPVEGDGVITEPGRYAVVCFIPVGADPKLVEAQMSAPPGTGEEGEPPDLGDGPPHFTKGMSAEFTVG